MADKQINELTVATDISDATTFPANNNTPTYEAQQVSVGQIANFIGARANAMHNIGDVFTNKSSKVELNPGCVPLWTGEYITNAKNIYPEFYNYLKVQNPGICISKQEYDTQVSSGECRYFVIDEEDGSIRFPKYNFVEPDYPYIYVFNASIPQSTSQGAEYTAALVSKVSKAGDTMTGVLQLNSPGNEVRLINPDYPNYKGFIRQSNTGFIIGTKDDASVWKKTISITDESVTVSATPLDANGSQIATANFVKSTSVQKSGDTMTGQLIMLNGQPITGKVSTYAKGDSNSTDTYIGRLKYVDKNGDTLIEDYNYIDSSNCSHYIKRLWQNKSGTSKYVDIISSYINSENGQSGFDISNNGFVHLPTPAQTSNGPAGATTAWVNSKILSQSIYQNKTALSSGTINLVENCSIYTHSPTANTTYTFNTTSLSKKSQCVVTFELMLKMPSTSITITFPTVKWLNETVPSLVNGKTNILAFRSIDGGATWMGNLQGIIA